MSDSYRLPMPLVDVDQAFTTVAELEDVMASLHARALWFLSSRRPRSTKSMMSSARTSGV